jgi:hypothetical protein
LFVSLYELLEQNDDDDDGYYSRKMIPSSTITTIEWLAQNCYIDTSSLTSASDFFRYCEVCRDHKTKCSKGYSYNNHGINRQQITICDECLRRYQEKRYELFGFGKPTGVIAVSVKFRVERLIMPALRLALMNNMKTKGNVRGGSSNGSSISISKSAASATEDDADINLNPEYDNIFYTAVANAFDHSPTVREYFHDNRSRIKPDNKSLWPLRYQAYKQFGI